jgi:hypothetical protein
MRSLIVGRKAKGQTFRKTAVGTIVEDSGSAVVIETPSGMSFGFPRSKIELLPGPSKADALESPPNVAPKEQVFPNWKELPDRSSAYLEFVRGHSCCVCTAPPRSDPHHFGPTEEKAMGRKVSDFRTVPMCRKHHDEFHSRGVIGTLSTIETRAFFLGEQVRLLIEWTRLGQKERS